MAAVKLKAEAEQMEAEASEKEWCEVDESFENAEVCIDNCACII